jgi:ferredoxin-NADP reductase
MPGKNYLCKVTEKRWLSPTTVHIAFEPGKHFHFEAGQFLSVVVPASTTRPNSVMRIYSLASAVDSGKYELCIKVVRGGVASNYLASLVEGDTICVRAPYGDFKFKPSERRHVFFIGTGSGIAPLRSISQSPEFLESEISSATLLFGAYNEKEILYPGCFESRGVETLYALSNAGPEWKGYNGNVCQFIRENAEDPRLLDADFYICGNPMMVMEMLALLHKKIGVVREAIHEELFSTGAAPTQVSPAACNTEEKIAA